MTQTSTNGLPTSIVATVSVTRPGGDAEPLVASRFVVDGREVALPFVLVLGGVALFGNVDDPQRRAGIAKAAISIGADLALSVLPAPDAPSTGSATTAEPQT